MKKTSLATIRYDNAGVAIGIVDDSGHPVTTKANAPAAPLAITANRTLTAADDGRTLYNNTATAYTITVPAGLPAGFGVALVQKSTGALTVAAAATVTVTSADGFTKTGGANKVVSVVNSGLANDYILSGQGAA